MENQLTRVFSNEEFGDVRVVVIDKEPWFAGKDVAAVLEYERDTKAIVDHVDEEDRQMIDGKTQSQFGIELGQRGGWLINESGLYSLVLSSKLPAAKKFKRWVTSEILPAIRKTGSFAMKPMSPLEMIRELADAAIKQEKQLAEHEARLTTMEEEKTQINSAIKEIQEKVEQKAYPYPDKKRRDKIRNSVWAFAKENLDFFVSNDNTVGENDVVNRINVSFQDDFIEKYGIDLSKELESAKLYYIGKYTQLKLDKMLTPDILRPAKIRDLSVQALISTSADWTNKAMSLLAGYKSQIKKTRNLYVVA